MSVHFIYLSQAHLQHWEIVICQEEVHCNSACHVELSSIPRLFAAVV